MAMDTGTIEMGIGTSEMGRVGRVRGIRWHLPPNKSSSCTVKAMDVDVVDYERNREAVEQTRNTTSECQEKLDAWRQMQ